MSDPLLPHLADLFSPTWRTGRPRTEDAKRSGYALGESPDNPDKSPETPFPGFPGSHQEHVCTFSPPEPASPAPLCTACQGRLPDPGDILCPACYSARRGPGKVLAFDPDRRSRTLARLAGRPCPDCQAVTRHVNGRGDATCQTYARRRAGFDEMSAREARP